MYSDVTNPTPGIALLMNCVSRKTFLPVRIRKSI